MKKVIFIMCFLALASCGRGLSKEFITGEIREKLKSSSDTKYENPEAFILTETSGDHYSGIIYGIEADGSRVKEEVIVATSGKQYMSVHKILERTKAQE